MTTTRGEHITLSQRKLAFVKPFYFSELMCIGVYRFHENITLDYPLPLKKVNTASFDSMQSLRWRQNIS